MTDAIEHWRERAAIMEYDGELQRANAESLALKEVVRIYGQDAGREVQRWREGNAAVQPRAEGTSRCNRLLGGNAKEKT